VHSMSGKINAVGFMPSRTSPYEDIGDSLRGSFSLMVNYKCLPWKLVQLVGRVESTAGGQEARPC
jgi:hypothetical protein